MLRDWIHHEEDKNDQVLQQLEALESVFRRMIAGVGHFLYRKMPQLLRRV